MTWKLELWVEGPTDAVTHRGRKDGEERAEPAEITGGALVPLVRAALAESPPLTREVLDEVLPETRMEAHRLAHKVRGKVAFSGGRRELPISTHARKVLMAMRDARSADPDTLVLAVWDRDGRPEPLRDRDGIHELLRRHGEQGAAVAICVEEVEAWLLADPAAFRRCFETGPKKGLPGNPEAELKAKEKLHEILEELEIDRDDFPTKYCDLAKKVDLDTLTRSCPRGFGELRKALREHITPCLSSGLPGA